MISNNVSNLVEISQSEEEIDGKAVGVDGEEDESMVSVLSLEWIFCGTQDWNKKRELYNDTNGKSDCILHPFSLLHIF